MTLQAFIAIWLLYLTTALAQQVIQPTNASSPTTTQLLLSFKQDGAQTTLPVDFAINASQFPPNSISPNYNISGNLVPVNSSYLNNVTKGDIACMSCDAEDYNSNNTSLGPDTVLDMVKDRLGGNETIGTDSSAIILYTTSSSRCNFTPTSDFNYQNVFIVPNVPGPPWKPQQTPAAERLAESLAVPNRTTISGMILIDQSSAPGGNNNTGGLNDSDDLGPTPTTTVAMIILYSVTGIITLCFIVVIITGAVRAHRHPDRYGLLNLPGGAHQRRARALGRAMLDSIPIIKFGEREPNKQVDTERGTELRERGGESSPRSQTAPITANAADGETSERSAEAPNTDNAESTPMQTPVSPVEGDAAEAGLACSVCTDDFVKGQDLRVLPCNHKFHPECIDPWLLNVSGTCPLCRVDLHPPQNGERYVEGEEGPQPTVTRTEGPALGYAANGTPIYRPLRLSTLLTPRRMRHATPEQRVRALRDLRDARRANGGDTSSETPPVPRIRGARLTRLFHRNTGSAVQSPVSPLDPEPPQLPEIHQQQPRDIESTHSPGNGEASNSHD